MASTHDPLKRRQAMSAAEESKRRPDLRRGAIDKYQNYNGNVEADEMIPTLEMRQQNVPMVCNPDDWPKA